MRLNWKLGDDENLYLNLKSRVGFIMLYKQLQTLLRKNLSKR